MTNSKPGLDAAYALETPEDNLALYADWAATYDSDFVDDTGYVLHRAVADAFVAAGGAGPILDIGAGTGACGAVLRAHGLTDLHATDLSAAMLAVAQQKGIYQSLFAGNILTGLDVPDDTYPGIVSSGTFTLGHVGPEGLDEVVRLLRPGGLAVISVRDTHFETSGFAAKVAGLEPLLARYSRTEAIIYEGTDDANHKDDRAILLHLWKA